MNDCLYIKLKEVIENGGDLPSIDDIVIISEATQSNGGSILNGVNNSDFVIDGVENPTSQQIAALDWNERHVLFFHNKQTRTTLRLASSYNKENPVDLDLEKFKSCKRLSELNINLRGKYQFIHGNLNNFASSKTNLSVFTLMSDFSTSIVGNVKDIAYKGVFKIILPNCSIDCDIAELTGAPDLKRLIFTSSKTAKCSDSVSRSSSAYMALGTFGITFETDEDVDNFFISNANCFWGTRGGSDKEINVIKDGYTPSAQVLEAISNLKTNMYANKNDDTRTQGTYFTSIKINGVEVEV